MKDTNICYPLQNFGYKGDIVITNQGLIIDRAKVVFFYFFDFGGSGYV